MLQFLSRQQQETKASLSILSGAPALQVRYLKQLPISAPFLLHFVSHSPRAGTFKWFMKLQKTHIFWGGSPLHDIVLLPFVFVAGMLMRASDLLGTTVHHTYSNFYPLSANSLLGIYFSFFRVRPAGLWLLLNLNRGSSTTATPPSLTPIILKHLYYNTHYTIKNLLSFPVKHLRCQRQPQCSLQKWSLPKGMLSVHKSGLCFSKAPARTLLAFSAQENIWHWTAVQKLFPLQVVENVPFSKHIYVILLGPIYM